MSLFFTESCFTFLFKVYVKHSQIWETLPTSKMEHFVAIDVCKVIFFRLMIRYTQYCRTSVFICVSSLLVPFCSRRFHQQASKMVLCVTRTIANAVFYWVMVLHIQFLSMNFLFFVSVRCWVHLASVFRYSQLVPGVSSSFQVFPARSK